jgi:ribosomal protein S18 acetylase RimI-like enzyme
VNDITITKGIPAEQVSQAVAIIYDAFHLKFAHEIAPRDREQAERIIEASMYPENGYAASDAAGTLLGLAGVATKGVHFHRLRFSTFLREFGFFGAIWRQAYALLDVLAYPRKPGVWRVEILAVAESARGRGIGTALLREVVRDARESGASAITLEVVDTNGRARLLYESVGFALVKTMKTKALTGGGGYDAVDFMRIDL